MKDFRKKNDYVYILKILYFALWLACEKVFYNLLCCGSGSAVIFFRLELGPPWECGSVSGSVLRVRIQAVKKTHKQEKSENSFAF